MIVRSIDTNGDWLFGKGFNDYRSNGAAVIQNINTRLNSWLGDCYFDQGAGVNWALYIGGKDELSLNLSVSAIILNTAFVLTMNQLSIFLNSQRQLSIAYNVTTTFSTESGQVAIAVPVG